MIMTFIGVGEDGSFHCIDSFVSLAQSDGANTHLGLRNIHKSGWIFFKAMSNFAMMCF